MKKPLVKPLLCDVCGEECTGEMIQSLFGMFCGKKCYNFALMIQKINDCANVNKITGERMTRMQNRIFFASLILIMACLFVLMCQGRIQ